MSVERWDGAKVVGRKVGLSFAGLSLAGLSLIGFSLVGAAVGAKEPPKSSPVDVAAIREAIEEQSQTAKTVGDFTAIIETIQGPKADKGRAIKDKYCREMLAWALNRRGEIYLKHATDQLADGNESESQRLDQLALEDFEASASHDPQKWKAFHNRGTSYAVAGKRKEALQDFSRVIELNPDYADAWHNRAELHFDAQEYAKAARDYTEALNRDEENRTALSKRGQCQLKLGKARAAIADFDRLIRIDAKQPTAYIERGDARQMLGDWEAAASDYRKAIELDHQQPIAYQRAAWLMATCPEERIRNSGLAIQAAEQALSLSPNLSGQAAYRYHDVLAAALANAGKYGEAREAIQKAIDAAPEDQQASLRARQELYQRDTPYRQKANSVAAK